MKRTNFGLLSVCVLVGSPLSVIAGTTDGFCLNDSIYPVHRDRVCSLEKWAANQEVPEKRSVLNPENSASLTLTPDDLAGDVLLMLDQGVFAVNRRYQNCKDVYETFNKETKKTAGTIECTAGNHDLVPSSSYGSGNGCSVKNNIEVCISSKLTLNPGDVNINLVQRKARYDGSLVKTTRKNELSYRQGYIPVTNGGITFFVKGTITDRRQISLVNEKIWEDGFYASVNPTPYFELSCLSEKQAKPVTVSLIYKDSTMTEIGFDGSVPVSTFTGERFTTFKSHCVDGIQLSLVNYQDIATSDWSVTFKRTGSQDAYVNELARFGSQLLTDAVSVITEYEIFQSIDTTAGSISDQVRAEISANWKEFAKFVQVKEFFDPKLSLVRYQDIDELLIESELSKTDGNGYEMPNFELMNLLVDELKAEHSKLEIDTLINPELDFIDFSYEGFTNYWNSVIVLSKVAGYHSDLGKTQGNTDFNVEEMREHIAQHKSKLQIKVSDITVVVKQFLEIVSAADVEEVKKLNALKKELNDVADKYN